MSPITSVGHVHAWGKTVCVDQCHYTLLVERCRECGATRESEVERDFTRPGQHAFAREDCPRCVLLKTTADIDVLSRAALTEL